jgi:hypothetical protein
MANKGVVQSAPLAPLNSPILAAADRPRVYGLIRKELNDALNGVSSFYPDGVKKSSSDLMSDLDKLIGSVTSLKDAVNDPTNIFGDAVRDLGGFREFFKKAVSNDIETMWDDPDDGRDSRIRLPDNLAPTTRDRNDLYVDPELGPFAPPNPLLPQHWSKDLKASFESPGGVGNAFGAAAPVFYSRLLAGRATLPSSPPYGNPMVDAEGASPPLPIRRLVGQIVDNSRASAFDSGAPSVLSPSNGFLSSDRGDSFGDGFGNRTSSGVGVAPQQSAPRDYSAAYVAALNANNSRSSMLDPSNPPPLFSPLYRR